jgi:hypothetical protein
MIPTEYQLTPVSFTTVHYFDPFWTPCFETNNAGWLTAALLSLRCRFCYSTPFSSAGSYWASR